MSDRIEEALRRARESAAFITVTAERARREGPGPLVAWKDLFDVAGTRTTNGSATRRDVPVATEDAPIVRNLAARGAVCVGKTNQSEFAFSGLGLNPHFGNPVNPLAPDRVPGGSSSGSAVAVADGIVDLAVGTDTSGSVRVPAAFCGLVGYKASIDRYDRTGMQPLAPSLDTIGVFTHDVAAAVRADAWLRGAPVESHETEFRCVVPTGELLDDCDPAVRTAFEDTLAALARSGVRIDHRPLPSLGEAQELMDRHGTLAVAEAYARHGHFLAGPSDVDPLVLRRLADFNAAGEPVVRAAQAGLRDRLVEELAGAVLLCPTVRDPAPAVAPLLADLDVMATANRRALRTTMLLSYFGLPGVAVPHGALPGGLRGSVLLSTPSGDDDRLLAVAAAIWPLLAEG
ncbi:amidase family protein [Actinophytocola sp.]|uniref:amidase family protein n=1 Tax=Actinophytocola sp. TaxID=1872138 RepID=UPI002ED0159D